MCEGRIGRSGVAKRGGGGADLDPVPVETGIEIIRALRGHTSGMAVPHFVVDAPGGGGKIPLVPEYVTGKDENHLHFKNYAGETYKYPLR